MCGIAGIFNLNEKKIERSHLIRFTDSLSHRGPDGAGYELFAENTLGLGHRRLSILDLSDLGHQPMSYANGRFWICYNGEVFNFIEIKKELEIKGHKFKSDTDTEVILAAYIEYGVKCLDKFNGMWSFAIWDNEKQELFVSRDRFGIKPLYYYHKKNEQFSFASETRSFKYLQDCSHTFDDQLLALNLSDTYALEGLGYTPFQNILQLLPGHYMLIKKDKEVKQQRWWNIHDHKRTNISYDFEIQKEEFYALFRDACKIRLISDVPVGTALSGGVDSTAVYSTVYDSIEKESLSRFNKDSQQAFTAIFPGLTNDEQYYADQAVCFTSGKINYVQTSTDELIKRIEEDTIMSDCICNSPLTSISSVYRGMRNSGIKVSMDGHGVDEMLYGYRDMVYSLYNEALWYGEKSDAIKYKEVLLHMYHPENINNAAIRFEKQLSDKKTREQNILFKIKRVIKKQNQSENEYLPIQLPSLSNEPFDFSRLPLSERMLHNEFFIHTLPALLRNFDRAGMMNGVEIRMPFMDWRLVSFIFSLPIQSKIGNGFTKLILRESMKGKMQEEIRIRKYKVGIGSPFQHWMNGPLKEWVMDCLTSSELKNKLNKSDQLEDAKVAQDIWKSINTELISK
jgi:asparagine synthase (glutamine-hydrolysing)